VLGAFDKQLRRGPALLLRIVLPATNDGFWSGQLVTGRNGGMVRDWEIEVTGDSHKHWGPRQANEGSRVRCPQGNICIDRSRVKKEQVDPCPRIIRNLK
jgi:hypothetical protein